MLELTPRGTPKFECESIHNPTETEYTKAHIDELVGGYDDRTPPIVRGSGVRDLTDDVTDYLISELEPQITGRVEFEIPIESLDEEMISRVTRHNTNLTVFVSDITNYVEVTETEDGVEFRFDEQITQISELDADPEIIVVPSNGMLEMGETTFKQLLSELDGIFEVGHLYPEPPMSVGEPLDVEDVSTVYLWVWEWLIHVSGAEWYPMRDYQDNLLGLQLEGRNNRRYIFYKRESTRLAGNPPEIVEGPDEKTLYQREVNLRPTETDTPTVDGYPSSCSQCVFWSVCLGGSPNHTEGGMVNSRSKWCKVHYDLYKAIDRRYEAVVESLRRVIDTELAIDTESLAIRRDLDIKPAGNLRPELIPSDQRGSAIGRVGIENNNPSDVDPITDSVLDSWENADIEIPPNYGSYAEKMVDELSDEDPTVEAVTEYNNFDELVADVKKTLPADVYSLENNGNKLVIRVVDSEHMLSEGDTFEERIVSVQKMVPEWFVEVDWINREIEIDVELTRSEVEQEKELDERLQNASPQFEKQVREYLAENDREYVTFDVENESIHLDSATESTRVDESSSSESLEDVIAKLEDRGLNIPPNIDEEFARTIFEYTEKYDIEYIQFDIENSEIHADSAIASIDSDSGDNEPTPAEQTTESFEGERNELISELERIGVDVPPEIDVEFARELVSHLEEFSVEHTTFDFDEREIHADSAMETPNESSNYTTPSTEPQSEEDMARELDKEIENGSVNIEEGGVISVKSDNDEPIGDE